MSLPRLPFRHAGNGWSFYQGDVFRDRAFLFVPRVKGRGGTAWGRGREKDFIVKAEDRFSLTGLKRRWQLRFFRGTPCEEKEEEDIVQRVIAWDHYQLCLFDFDGVLADTESLHLKAYQRMCARRGFDLMWDLQEYAKLALFRASGIKESLYRLFPKLYAQEPSWEVLYGEKRAAYLALLEEEGAALMPGVAALLEQLQRRRLVSCVVTHSPREQIDKIVQHHPILATIPHWITRECYGQPKPHPECYRTALERYAQPNDRVVGFEDSPRGMMALSQTAVTPYLVTSFLEPEQIATLRTQVPQPFTHIPSFADSLLELTLYHLS